MRTVNRNQECYRLEEAIKRTEAVVETFPDELEKFDSDSACIEAIVNLRKEFRLLAMVCARQFDSLEHVIQTWRQRVFCGDDQFVEEEENALRNAATTWCETADLLWEKSEVFRQKNLLLGKPTWTRALILERKQLGERLLKNWVTPKPTDRPPLRSKEVTPEQFGELRKSLMRRGE